MIKIRDITFGYEQNNKILDEISFDIDKNHCIAVMGNNGAGKSTLIKCLNRVNKPSKGYVEVEDVNIFKIKVNEVAKYVGYVAQKNEITRLTVYDAVLLGRKPYIKWDATREDLNIVESSIEKLGLSEFKMRFIDELSGGELQKVMLARALSQQPKFLLLDEPTSNLDPKNQYEVMKLVKTISKQHDICSVIVIHDINLALRYCDKFLLLKDSQIYSYGGQETITSQSIRDIYDMPVKITKVDGIKITIPYPEEIG